MHFIGSDVEFLAHKSESELHSSMESLDIGEDCETEKRLTTEFCCLTKVDPGDGTIVRNTDENKLFGTYTETHERPWACKQEMELHSVMASLDISEDCKRKTLQSFVPQFHSMKIPLPAFDMNNKRRCHLLPKKRCERFVTSSSGTNRKGISKCLETIFEEEPCIIRSGHIRRRQRYYCRGYARKLKLNKVRARRKMNMDDFIARFHEMMGTNENYHCANLTKSSASLVDEKIPDN